MAAAMRLCGRALRRTQQSAAVSTQQRWVSTRWFGKTRATTAEEQRDLARAAVMKEELYNTVFDITKKYKVPGKIGRENRLLLERLSVQVQPRPNDPYWRSCRRTEITNHILTAVGSCSLSFMAPLALGWLITAVTPRKKNLLEQWWDAVFGN